MASFEHWWREHFGDLVPRGEVLREHFFEDRWFRIHSLPESKRWPTQASEYNEILRRHNAIATDVLGVGSSCWLVATHWFEADAGKTGPPVLPHLDPGAWDKPLLFREDPDDPLVTACWPTLIKWAPGEFDALLRMVADDKEPQPIFVETAQSRIYAPYDGGADLILESAEVRDAMRARYPAWLSPDPRGL
jgi:hypothetical protein